MPSCAARGCKNSSGSVKMNLFPRDPERRKVWVQNSGVNPTKYSQLCEFHFASDMWEKVRVDGKKKLKCNAVPTIFGDLAYQHSHKNQGTITENISLGKAVLVETNTKSKEVKILSSTTSASDVIKPMLIRQEAEDSFQYRLPNEPGEFTIEENQLLRENLDSTMPENLDSMISNDHSLQHEESTLKTLRNNFNSVSNNSIQKEYEKLEKLYLKSERLRLLMKKRYQQKYTIMAKTINRLQKTVQDQSSRIGQILNEDQLDMTSGRYKKCPKWCDKSLVTGLKFKFACGVSGYKELKKHGIPLPSIRTLQRQLQHWDFKSG